MTAAISERTSELLLRFNLTTAASELAPRLEQAGQHEVLSLVLEVLEMEAEAREQRKIGRLRRASQLPPGKTFETLVYRVKYFCRSRRLFLPVSRQG
jgi:hypothetical protein